MSDESAPAPGQTEDAAYPYDEPMARKAYERELRALQIELLKLQRWIRASGERLLLLFEGRDAAGKGGTIKRFTQHINPRGARIVALTKPNDTERGQWYFQRYIAHLPSAGEIVFFDRSWYNRAGVEPVMGFCNAAQYAEFMRQAPDFEQALVDSGIRLFKFWLAVSRQEQLRRFDKRRADPLKQWKLSPVDEASLDKWDAYTEARDRMFHSTHTPFAPWTVVRSDDKRRARIHSIRHVLAAIDYDGRDAKVAQNPDDQVVCSARTVLPRDDRVLFGRREE